MRQSEISRRREHEVQKLKKDVELMAVQYESSEAGLRKRHQDAVNDLTDQLEQSNKQRSKSVPAPCRLRGCKNRPSPSPGRMSHKATEPGFVLFRNKYLFSMWLLCC